MPSVVPFVLGHRVAVDDTDSSLLARPSLLADLHQAAQQPVCVLHAPAGSGKSILIAQYLPYSRQQQAVAWLRLTAREREPVRFFRQLSDAIRRNIADFAGFTSLQHHSAHAEQQGALASERLSDGLRRLNQPLQIIIDNLDLLVDCPWLPALQKVVETSPSSVRWLLSGRNARGIDPSHWPLRDTSALFSAEPLFFSQDDTRRLLNAGRTTPLPEALTDRLHQYSRGWPAALKLAQICLRNHDATQPIPDSLFGRDIFSCLFRAAVASFDMPFQQFLIQSAFLEQLSVPLCNHALNSMHSEQHIDQLKNLGLFIEPDTLPGEYRIHTLFRDHLLESFQQQSAPERERLVNRACLWMVDHGQREAACRVSRQHSQEPFFNELLRACLREWLHSGEADPVYYWARELDEAYMPSIPDTRYAWHWAQLMFGEFAAAGDGIQLTLTNASAGPLPWDRLLQCTDTPQNTTLVLLCATIRLLQGNNDPALLDTLQRMLHLPRLSNGHRASIENILSRHAIQQCHFREARQRATLALHTMENVNNRLGYALAAYLIANACFHNNDIRTARALCHQHLNHAVMASGNIPRTLLDGFDIYLAYQSHEPVEAEQRIHDLLLRCQPGFSMDLQLYLTTPLLHMKTRRGDFLGAELLLQQLECSVDASGSAQMQAHRQYQRVRLAFARNDSDALNSLEQQLSILQSCEDELADSTQQIWEVLERRIMSGILILLYRGELDRAHQWIKQLQYRNVDHGYPIRFLPLNVCLAFLEYKLGWVSAAFRRLNDSLTQAEATGMLTGLLDDIPDLDSFVAMAIQQKRILNPQHEQALRELNILPLRD